MKHSSLSAALLGSAAILAPATAQAGTESLRGHFDHVLGTSLDMAVVAFSQGLAQIAIDAARAEITRLDGILSAWRPGTELSALNAAAHHAASPDLFAVIASGEHWRSATGGAFSLRLGALESATRAGAPFDSAAMARAIGAAPVTLDAATRRIERPEGVVFAVDGIAKGYVIDRALEAARAVPGVTGVMVDIGGDLRCWGQSPDAKGWRIGVTASCAGADNAAPAAVIDANDRAIATSGRGARDQIILDPASGARVTHVAMATAVAPTAMDADALASAFSVMAPARAIAMADATPGVAAHIVDSNGVAHISDGWARIQMAQNGASRSAPTGASVRANAWPSGYAARIDFEIPNVQARRARPPYVTLWVTDDKGELVRTLAFYAEKKRYMHENYVFWKRFGEKDEDMVDSITRPTRPPGRYTLEWDGKDDQGRAVSQGSYTLNIEAAREHGGHSIQRIELRLGASPVTADAAAQDELGATHVRYGR